MEMPSKGAGVITEGNYTEPFWPTEEIVPRTIGSSFTAGCLHFDTGEIPNMAVYHDLNFGL